jgi:hypothetical protein
VTETSHNPTDWLIYNRYDPSLIEASFATEAEAAQWVRNSGAEGTWGMCLAKDWLPMMRQD